MKQLITFAMLIIMISCNEKKPVIQAEAPTPKTSYFKYVYNDCTKKWAIQLGKDTYFNEDGGFAIISSGEIVRQPWVELGYEKTFDSKEQAIAAYAAYVNNERIIDSARTAVKVRAAFIKDSIFKCQHSYQ